MKGTCFKIDLASTLRFVSTSKYKFVAKTFFCFVTTLDLLDKSRQYHVQVRSLRLNYDFTLASRLLLSQLLEGVNVMAGKITCLSVKLRDKSCLDPNSDIDTFSFVLGPPV